MQQNMSQPDPDFFDLNVRLQKYKNLAEIYTLMRIEKILLQTNPIEGTTNTFKFTLPVNWPEVYYDFKDGQCDNLPPDSTITFVNKKVAELTLYNEGNASLFYDTNKHRNEGATSELETGQVKVIKASARNIWSLVLQNRSTAQVGVIRVEITR